VRTFLITVLALTTGALGGYEAWRFWGQTQAPDPVQVIVTQMKTHSVIEHERQVAVWYRACPTVWGKSPQIFMAWPARLTYQVELSDIQVSRQGGVISVRTSGIHAVDPSVPTDRMGYMAATSMLTFANEQELINEEIAKATPVARYLSAYFLAHDPSLQQDFREEVQSLVEHFGASLGVPITQVEVDIPQVEVSSGPQLPRIELCQGTTAAINGLPFAKFELGKTLPIGFKLAPRLLPRQEPPAQGASSSSSAAPGPPPAATQAGAAAARQGLARGTGARLPAADAPAATASAQGSLTLRGSPPRA
jgi:hypothetical protein